MQSDRNFNRKDTGHFKKCFVFSIKKRRNKNIEKINQKVIDRDKLVDIRDVVINTDLPKEEKNKKIIYDRLKILIVLNVANMLSSSKFSENGLSLEDCLKGILL